MKKIDVLVWGVKHIASNYNVECDTDYEEYGSMSIMATRVPILSDARMLCKDLDIPVSDCYVDSSWDTIVIDVYGWAQQRGQEEYTPSGLEMWKRFNAKIGE